MCTDVFALASHLSSRGFKTVPELLLVLAGRRTAALSNLLHCDIVLGSAKLTDQVTELCGQFMDFIELAPQQCNVSKTCEVVFIL